MSKNKLKWLVGCIITFILLSNYTFIHRYLPQPGPYTYCSNRCDFEDAEPAQDKDPLGKVEIRFYKYQVLMRNSDLKLYRRFERKWWQFWNWHNFLTHRRWWYDYAERDTR
jgi:hypothetical protein